MQTGLENLTDAADAAVRPNGFFGLMKGVAVNFLDDFVGRIVQPRINQVREVIAEIAGQIPLGTIADIPAGVVPNAAPTGGAAHPVANPVSTDSVAMLAEKAVMARQEAQQVYVKAIEEIPQEAEVARRKMLDDLNSGWSSQRDGLVKTLESESWKESLAVKNQETVAKENIESHYRIEALRKDLSLQLEKRNIDATIEIDRYRMERLAELKNLTFEQDLQSVDSVVRENVTAQALQERIDQHFQQQLSEARSYFAEAGVDLDERWERLADCRMAPIPWAESDGGSDVGLAYGAAEGVAQGADGGNVQSDNENDGPSAEKNEEVAPIDVGMPHENQDEMMGDQGGQRDDDQKVGDQEEGEDLDDEALDLVDEDGETGEDGTGETTDEDDGGFSDDEEDQDET